MRNGGELLAVLTAALLVASTSGAFPTSETWSSGTVTRVQAPWPAPQLIIVTDGPRTVLSVRPDEYDRRGEFLMVVPVDGAVGVPEVSTLLPAAFTRVHESSAPHLLELWECDPCEPQSCSSRPIPRPHHEPHALQTTPSEPIPGRPLEFDGYEVALVRGLPRLRRWLEARGVETLAQGDLDSYDGPRWSFLTARQTRERDGSGTVKALRISYQTRSLQLPWILPRDERGRSEMLVHVIARERYDFDGLRSTRAPAGSEVGLEVSGRFSEFYEKQVEPQLETGGVVVEHVAHPRVCRECVELGVDLVFPRGHEKERRVVLGRKLASSERGSMVQRRLEQCDRWPREESLTLRLEPSEESALHVSVLRGNPNQELIECVRTRARREMEGLEADTVTLDFARAPGGKVRMRELAQDVPLVLTRLRARFVGPRERRLSLKPAPGSAFQTQYELRHPWRGAVKCASPKFGRWGFPPIEDSVEAIEHAVDPEAARAAEPGGNAGPRGVAAPVSHRTPPARLVLGVLLTLGLAALVLGLLKFVSRKPCG